MNTTLDMPAHQRRVAIIKATNAWLSVYGTEPQGSVIMGEADSIFESALIENGVMTKNDAITNIEDGIAPDCLVIVDFDDGTQMEIYRNGFTMRGLV